jgi:hypothetical protein
MLGSREQVNSCDARAPVARPAPHALSGSLSAPDTGRRARSPPVTPQPSVQSAARRRRTHTQAANPVCTPAGDAAARRLAGGGPVSGAPGLPVVAPGTKALRFIATGDGVPPGVL